MDDGRSMNGGWSPAAWIRLVSAFVFASIAPASVALGATILVPDQQPTIQAGILAAAAGDTVLVAPGTYTGPGNRAIDFSGKDVVLLSSEGPELTVIDCEGLGRAFYLIGSLTEEAVIEGFTMRNGKAEGDPLGGGAIFVAGGALRIVSCRFEENRASGYIQNGGGGAISGNNATMVIADCVFVGNETSGFGARGGAVAAYNSHIQVIRCVFADNAVASSDGAGGGLSVLWVSSPPAVPVALVEDCEFTRNRATAGGAAYVDETAVSRTMFGANQAEFSGGGVVAHDSMFEQCDFDGNRSVVGGGARFVASTVLRCRFVENVAEDSGGGMQWIAYNNTARECLVRGNRARRGGGISGSRAEASVIGCTVVNNEAEIGSGVYVSSGDPVAWILENSIISGGATGQAVDCAGNVVFEATCTDAFGNAGGDWIGCIGGQNGVDGNFSANPRFCGPDDFTLAGNSPCLPGNHPQGANCGIIGAFGEACPPIAVEAVTWGAIKAEFRE
jgi:hypothetical protein